MVEEEGGGVPPPPPPSFSDGLSFVKGWWPGIVSDAVGRLTDSWIADDGSHNVDEKKQSLEP